MYHFDYLLYQRQEILELRHCIADQSIFNRNLILENIKLKKHLEGLLQEKCQIQESNERLNLSIKYERSLNNALSLVLQHNQEMNQNNIFQQQKYQIEQNQNEIVEKNEEAEKLNNNSFQVQILNLSQLVMQIKQESENLRWELQITKQKLLTQKNYIKQIFLNFFSQLSNLNSQNDSLEDIDDSRFENEFFERFEGVFQIS